MRLWAVIKKYGLECYNICYNQSDIYDPLFLIMCYYYYCY